MTMRAALHDLSCVVHVHSIYSDGTATVPEILAAARANAVDAVLLTDHDSLGALQAGWEGWHDSVLLLVGHEVSPRGGHFLAFGLEEEIDHRGLTEEQICTAVHARGGFGFAAHPFSRGSRISSRIGRAHPWPALERCPLAGVEVWSLLTDAAEAWRNPREVIAFLRDPPRILDGPPRRHLEAWDALCAKRRVAAVGGLDAHQTGIRVRDRVFTPMPHARYFGYLHTHALCEEAPTGDLAHDRHQVYAALRNGRCYLALEAFGSAKGFRFWAERAGETLEMGGERDPDGWRLRAVLPRPAGLRLLRDGALAAELQGTSLDHMAKLPGAYRLEARLQADGRERVWIVSNPIYLRTSV
jgi:hypothetical protein